VSNYSATIDWGDGSPVQSGAVNLVGNTFSVMGSHSFARAGSFTVTVTMRSSGGSTATAQAMAVVTTLSVDAASVVVSEGAATGRGVVAPCPDPAGPPLTEQSHGDAGLGQRQRGRVRHRHPGGQHPPRHRRPPLRCPRLLRRRRSSARR